jgi:hypothetical protein
MTWLASTASWRSHFNDWKAKFGDMDVFEAKRLRALGEESGKLKRLLADTMLDNTAPKDLGEKKIHWRNTEPGKPRENGYVDPAAGSG